MSLFEICQWIENTPSSTALRELGKPLKGPGVGLLDVLRATEYVGPSIEIIDARVENPRKIFDTVADNAAAAGIVTGGRPAGPTEVDLR